MNDYSFQDIFVGMEASFQREITAEMMEKFRELSGDPNPLHIDGEFARSHGFPDRVVYGLLSLSLISAFGGGYLPGKRCLIQGVEAKFLRPVFVGDTLRVTGQVVRLDADFNFLEIRVNIFNQNSEKVIRGKLNAGVLDEK